MHWQRYLQRNSIKFSLYWTALAAPFLILSMVIAWRTRVKPLQFQAPTASTYDVFLPDVSLTAEAVSVDPISRTIIMNWYPELTSVNCSSNQSTVVDIYLPNTLLDISSPSWTTQKEDQPAFRLNSTQNCFQLVQAYASFRTVTKLTASKEYDAVQAIQHQSSFQSYPFDVYLAPIAFYTQNVETGAVTALKVSQAFGIAANFEISLLNTYVRLGYREYLQIYLRIERSIATKIFVVVVAVMNWLAAAVFLTISAAAVVYSNSEIYSGMFIAPLGALFVFSFIRANLPGAPPGFGATIDTFTIVPVLVIISACSFSLLLAVLFRRIRVDTRKEKQEAMKKDLEWPGLPDEKGAAPGSSNQGPPEISVIQFPPSVDFEGVSHVQSHRTSSDFTKAEEIHGSQGN